MQDMFRVHSVFRCQSSGPIIESLMQIHFRDAETVLDPTYGRGVFWRNLMDYPWYKVYATDRDPDRSAIAHSIKWPFITPLPPMDVTNLDIEDKTYDVGVFDPPFLAQVSDGKADMESKYSTVKSQAAALALYSQGMKELVRVCRLGMIVKCKDGVSSGRYWPVEAIVTMKGSKLCGRHLEDKAVFVPACQRVSSGKWRSQQHLRRDESYFLLWRFDKGLRKERT